MVKTQPTAAPAAASASEGAKKPVAPSATESTKPVVAKKKFTVNAQGKKVPIGIAKAPVKQAASPAA